MMFRLKQRIQKPLTVLAFAYLASIAMGQDSTDYGITSFTPTSGPPGTLVTITGPKLGTDTTSVKINGVTASFSKPQTTVIKAYVPSAASTGPITVSGPLGTRNSASVFTVTGTDGGTTGGGSTGGSTGGAPPVDPPPHIAPPSGARVSHPRMWVRTEDLPRLQAWAIGTNKVWLDLQAVANKRKTDMIQGKYPQLDSGDGEGSGFAYPVEEAAELFAFMSLVDPSPANRADWATRAHDLLMIVIDQAALGAAPNQKFRTPHFATFNRSRWYGEAFPLVVDWCYSRFTTAEKAKVRKVFIRWIHDILDPTISGGAYSLSAGQVTNNPSLLGTKNLRWSANNYWGNHARNIAMMSLALDEADDQPAIAGDFKAGYLRDYIGNAIGAWMYVRNHADTHDLAGGLSPEGPGYGESSFSALTMMMLALHTAGYDKASVYGPGAEMANNPYWKNELTTAYLHSLSPQTTKFYSYQPWMYLPAGYGDVLRLETFDMIRAFAPLGILDMADGSSNSERLNAIRWIQTWTPPGGPSNLDNRLIGSTNAYGTMLPILYFLLFDPQGPVPTDPRVGMPTDYFAPGGNRILSRTSWGSEASWFSFISTWNTIDHQWGDANSFSFYRKGEFITKEWSGYGKNLGSTDFQNNISIENPPGSTAQSYIKVEGEHGSQFSYMSDGDPTVLTSMHPDFVYVEGDATKRFNSTSNQATDVQHASRSILYIKPDVLVIYDRATSKSAGKAKRFFLNFETQPVIDGHTATVTTTKGQKVFVSSLLPAAGALSWDKPSTFWSFQESTVEEPMKYRLIAEDPSKPQNVRFLHVLQGADSGTTPLVTTNFPAGASYNGALVGNAAVLFAVNLGQTFTGLTYTVPVNPLWNYVTGLVPGAGYTVTKTPTGNGLTVTVVAGGPTIANEAGVLRFRGMLP